MEEQDLEDLEVMLKRDLLSSNDQKPGKLVYRLVIKSFAKAKSVGTEMVKITTIIVTAVKKRHRLGLSDVAVVGLSITGTFTGKVKLLEGKSMINIFFGKRIHEHQGNGVCVPVLW